MPDQSDSLSDVITISLPDVLTGEVWQAYVDGQESYNRRAEGEGRTPATALAKFSGAAEIIRRGYVHVSGPGAPKLTQYVHAEARSVPLPIIAALNVLVARRLESAFSDPFLDGAVSLRGLLGITNSQSATPPPSN